MMIEEHLDGVYTYHARVIIRGHSLPTSTVVIFTYVHMYRRIMNKNP